MTRETRVIIAIVAGSALLVGGAIVAAVVWFSLVPHPNELAGPLTIEEPVDDLGQADEGDYEDPAENELRTAEKQLGPEHADLVPLLTEVAEVRLLDGNADDAILLLERAVRILERGRDRDPAFLQTLDVLADAYTRRQDHPRAIAALEKIVARTEGGDAPADAASALVRLAAAHVRAGHNERAQPLVARARRLFNRCVARGECDEVELLSSLTELDIVRMEVALATGDSATAKRLMRDIVSRATRHGGEPCDGVVEVYARVGELVAECERMVRTDELERTDRMVETVFRMLALAESGGDCAELVDPYLVSDLTLALLRSDLEAGRYNKAHSRIDRLSGYARAHFDRGQLRETVRYDITEMVLEVAEAAAGDVRLEKVHRLQRFVLQLYEASGLSDGPSMCEVVTAMSDADRTTLEDHLAANEVDAAQTIADGLTRRFDDFRIRGCASELLHDLALTFGEQAATAADRDDPAQASQLVSIAERLCRKSGPECQQEIRDIQRELRR